MTTHTLEMSSCVPEALSIVGTVIPNKVAVAEGTRSLTFGALVEQAHSLCNRLGETGIQPGQRVAVILPNGVDFVVAAFAVWMRGAILVPLHTRFREEEILKYVKDCDIRAMLSNVRLGHTVTAIQSACGSVEHAWLSLPGGQWKYHGRGGAPEPACPAASWAIAVKPDWPALSQYSTGSTGSSKRVTRSHGQLMGEATTVSKVLGIANTDRVLGIAPFFHCYGLINAVLCPILSGATVFAANDFFPRDIARLIESERITGFPGVPFMYQLLAELRESSDFSSLRYAISAGAPLPESTGEAFRRAYRIRIRQLYGSTETGVISMEREDESHPPSVGYALPGVSLKVVDEAGRTAPAGIEGLVMVKSPFAALGYDSAPEKAESFFEEGQFSPGDMGIIRSTGELALGGRKRGFINVAGNKVDPAEVEAILSQHPDISEAVVVGIPDGTAGQKVKAIIVASSPCSRNAVIEYCRPRLADFKWPKVIEFRKEIPRSPLGKVLRKYLVDCAAEPTYGFDPRSGLTRHSNGACPDDLSSLPPFLRVLLATDGTVTKNLEAHFLEPIQVNILLHVRALSDRRYPEIDVNPSDAILKRRVLLRSETTGSVYAFAESVMTCNVFPEDLERGLIEERKGIGELIRARRLETYREVTTVEKTQAGEWAGYLGVNPAAAVAARIYRIFYSGRPVLQILEVFPVSRFQ